MGWHEMNERLNGGVGVVDGEFHAKRSRNILNGCNIQNALLQIYS